MSQSAIETVRIRMSLPATEVLFEVVICPRCKRIRRYSVGTVPPVICGLVQTVGLLQCQGRFRKLTPADVAREVRRWNHIPKEE